MSNSRAATQIASSTSASVIDEPKRSASFIAVASAETSGTYMSIDCGALMLPREAITRSNASSPPGGACSRFVIGVIRGIGASLLDVPRTAGVVRGRMVPPAGVEPARMV